MTDAADLLVELGCEELPPRALPDLARAFFDNVADGLANARIGFDRSASRPLYTPRRMALCLAGVAERQSDEVQERYGPARSAAFDDAGRPTPAAAGFARSVGKSVDELELRETDKGERLYCALKISGKPLDDLLYPVLAAALEALPVPRPMRWADHDYRFVRPVHWLLVLHGDRVLEGELYGCSAGRLTRGHRIHAPGPHEVAQAGDYLQVLREARVEADPDARAERIRSLAAETGRNAGGETRVGEALLGEVANLVEWPVAVHCRFDEAFLEVPQEALVASMEDHQKFFPVFDPDSGRLTASFVVIANLESRDPDAMRAGYERVVRPRLADARFFWDRDRRVPLADRAADLDRVVFQKELGTIGDKSRRMAALSRELAEDIGEDADAAERAARLCKCDLVTQMVGEFPELQGVMGGHYARVSGEPDVVADAIASHYRPRFAGDTVPTDALGRIVALADRLDSLVGVFTTGPRPSGNKDPFALRRAALGVVRILLEGNGPWPLDHLLERAARQLASSIPVNSDVLDEVRRFILERLRNHLREQGVSANQVHAVLAAPLGSLPDLKARVDAVREFMARPEAESLVVANKRIGNILRGQDGAVSGEIAEDLLVLPEEKALFEEVNGISGAVTASMDAGDYADALSTLAGLRGSVDRYFDHVMVMDEDAAIRANRLAQLAQLKSLFDRVADFAVAD